MRKTIIQLLGLIAVGAVIFWKEWANNFMTNHVSHKNIPTITHPILPEPTHDTIIWLVLVAGGLYLLTEVLTKYLKLSSPNSV